MSTISPARNSTKPSRSSTSRRAPGTSSSGSPSGDALDAAHHELHPAAVVLRLAEDAHRVALAEAPVEHRRVLEHHAPDAARAVGQLERQERAARARPAALLAQHREGRVDELPGRQVADPDLLRGGGHRASSTGTIRARCRPLRAPPKCGRSARSTTRRSGSGWRTWWRRRTTSSPRPTGRPLLARSPYNVVRLILPDGDEAQGQRPLLPLAARGRAGAGAAALPVPGGAGLRRPGRRAPHPHAA